MALVQDLSIFIATCFVLVTAAQAEHNHHLKRSPLHMEQFQQCVNDTGVTPEMMKSLRAGDENFPQELMCFMKCRYEKSQLIKEDGTVDVEPMRKANKIRQERENELVECLAAIEKIESCDGAIEIQNCFKKHRKHKINKPNEL